MLDINLLINYCQSHTLHDQACNPSIQEAKEPRLHCQFKANHGHKARPVSGGKKKKKDMASGQLDIWIYISGAIFEHRHKLSLSDN